MTAPETIAELARLGVATVYEAGGRTGLIDHEWKQLVPGVSVAGPARIALCGAGDNRAVHEAVALLQPGEILVLTMEEAAPVALIGDLLVTQIRRAGAAGVLVDAAVRDAADLATMGLPISARWVRARGATKSIRGQVDVPVTVGGATINPGDIVILDADGATVVAASQAESVLAASLKREQNEATARQRYLEGTLSYDQHGFREEDKDA
ncbi:4-hydroxy-4-methyl-2-oxoglutarate aldolase [Homoserinimonas aerilata]|uniref:Putative 4-hydroxy-4-methyl-2-oxoglutarate aldolase n=1 Tax=Homoserinimonas aerilata TaxID=1162970 RepID=A0A542YAC4_9MICO|nr:dimethylmenaquinone methyltransferase [Homoserinimonas aerilata]TQL45035.1 4-hydroxy-4-methyl-2-oxoglutarate aldolase [Homoserinimonas aerilata]